MGIIALPAFPAARSPLNGSGQAFGRLLRCKFIPVEDLARCCPLGWLTRRPAFYNVSDGPPRLGRILAEVAGVGIFRPDSRAIRHQETLLIRPGQHFHYTFAPQHLLALEAMQPPSPRGEELTPNQIPARVGREAIAVPR